MINNIEANYQENLEVMKKYQVLQQAEELKLEDVMEKKIKLIDENGEKNYSVYEIFWKYYGR